MENMPTIQIKKFVFMRLTSIIMSVVLSVIFLLLLFLLLAFFTGGASSVGLSGSTISILVIVLFLLRLFSLPIEVWRLAMIRYNFEKDVLSIRGGIIARYEKNLLYSKIQHVVITQSFLERMFGIANVIVQTAGNDGMSMQQNSGQNKQLAFDQPAVPALLKEDAEKMKNAIISRLSKFKGQGL